MAGPKQPHAEQPQPGQHLHHSQPLHHRWHGRQGISNVANPVKDTGLRLRPAERLQVRGRVFGRRQYRDKYRAQKRRRTKLEGVERCQWHAIGGAPGDVQPFAQDVGKNVSQRGANTDEKTLHDEAQRTLFVIEPVSDKGPERLHADVDAAVENPEQRRRNPQRWRVWHGKQRQTGQNGPGQKVGPAAAQARPCPVTQRADNRLDDEARHRRGQPEQGNLIRLCTEFFVDGAHVGHLQAPAELDAQKAKIHGENVAHRATTRQSRRRRRGHGHFVLRVQTRRLPLPGDVAEGHQRGHQAHHRSQEPGTSFFSPVGRGMVDTVKQTS